MVLDWVSVKDHGAMGNYDPAASKGNDDTNAIQAALNASLNDPHRPPVYIPSGVYKVTKTLRVGNGTKLFGAGRNASFLWGDLPGLPLPQPVPVEPLLHLGPPSSEATKITLSDFGIVGGSSPGTHAITAWGVVFCDIDIYVNGGWMHMFYVWRNSPGISGPEGGGIENCDIKLWQVYADSTLPFDPSLVPDPTGGIYVRGWVNGSWLWASIGSVRSGGDGIHLEGSYGSANDCHISGILQGISGVAVSLSGQGSGTHIEDLHCERGDHELGQFDIEIIGHSNVTVGPNVVGGLHLQACFSPIVIQHNSTVTIEANVTSAILVNGAGSPPLVNSSPSTMGIGYIQDWRLSSQRSGPTPFSPAGDVNLILNGDMQRFVGPAGGAQNIWGVSGYYVATQTGDDLRDPTRTRYSQTAALMSLWKTWGSSAYWPLFEARELPAPWVGTPVTASFKWKSVASGGNELYALAVEANAIGSAYGDQVSASNSVPVENGFFQYAFTFTLTEAFITNGVGLQLSFPDQPVYISEVQAVLGSSAPRSFSRQTRDLRGRVELMPGGRLRWYRGLPPTSGGDPLFNSPWQPGDLIDAYPAVDGGPVGWVCTVTGSPGTWKVMGTLPP